MKRVIFLILIYLNLLYSVDSSIIFGTEKIDTKASKILDNVLEGLVTLDKNGNPMPQIANRWDISGDGRKYRFYLDENIICHDNSIIDAHAVAYSLSMFIDSRHPYYEKDGDFEIVSSINILDSRSIEIELKGPFSPFLAFLSEDKTKIYSKSAFEKKGLSIKDVPIGSGPYMIKEWDGESRVVLHRFDKHRSIKPKIEKVIFKANKNIKDNILALKSGEINMIDSFTASDSLDIAKIDGVEIQTFESFTTIYLALNTQKSLLSKKSTREAIAHAINRTNLIKYVYGYGFVSADSFLPQGMWAYTKDIKPYSFDQKRSSEILKSNGMAGKELKLYFYPRLQYPPKLAELIKNQLESVGLIVKIVTPPSWSAFLSAIEHGEHDMCILNWTSDNGDPDNFMKLFTIKNADIPALNDSFFKHEELDKIIKDAREINSLEKRKELYNRAQHIINDEAPSIPLTYFMKNIAIKKSIKGVDIFPTSTIKFHNAHIGD